MLTIQKMTPLSLTQVGGPAANFRSELPFLKIPNGYPLKDRVHSDLWTNADSRLTNEELSEFFTPDVLRERLIACPTMNRDETDDWGMFGYEPGFFFIQSGRAIMREPETVNEINWVDGNTLRLVETPTGLHLPAIRHKDFMPRNSPEIVYQEVRESKNPNTFRFLCKLVFGLEEFRKDKSLLEMELAG